MRLSNAFADVQAKPHAGRCASSLGGGIGAREGVENPASQMLRYGLSFVRDDHRYIVFSAASGQLNCTFAMLYAFTSKFITN
jgi:hypothetical protein